ncbi:MAG: hypothetical protein IPH72_33155 [Sandaracinaceae bacterium]|nr:hypothetical protein [Sandaracinaceae bacterium]
MVDDASVMDDASTVTDAGSEGCAAGSAMDGDACAPCEAGTHCPGGLEPALLCASAMAWDDDLDPATACVPLTPECGSGAFETEPTATSDRVCTLCVADVTWDHDASAATACVAVSTEVCAVGSFRVPGTPVSDRQCVACALGATWDHDADPLTACAPVSAPCAAGTFEVPPTTTSDRTCTPCVLGVTFDHDQSALTACVPVGAPSCAPGTFDTPATATSDRLCVSCVLGTTWDDDGNSATACQPLSPACAGGHAGDAAHHHQRPRVHVMRGGLHVGPRRNANDGMRGGQHSRLWFRLVRHAGHHHHGPQVCALCTAGSTWDHDGFPGTACAPVSPPCAVERTTTAAPTPTSDRV